MAKIKFLESEIDLLIKKGGDNKIIAGKRKEINSLRNQIKSLK